jgi:hypothetical protein
MPVPTAASTPFTSRWSGALLLTLVGLNAEANGNLGIPDSIDGYPVNLGLLIVGHSTSAQGAYPAKLVTALNDPSHVADGRHYVAFPAIVGGDGGLLWSVLSVTSDDFRYHRVTASQGPGESAQPQWCETADTLRWSCRRARVDHLLTGNFPIPDTGSCATANVDQVCAQAASVACTWYDRTRPLNQNPVTQNLSPHECWLRMDYRVALIQDTSNRSWPIDDDDNTGAMDANDRWVSTRILQSRALPCPASAGVIGTTIDWNCDLTIDADDGELGVYAGWLRRLAEDLLSPKRYGEAALDAVFIGHKPTEFGQCGLWPAAERPACQANPHALRTPQQIASTPGRPLDRYHVPSVFWEFRVLETLFATPGLDPRIRPAAPGQVRRLWDRSADCYASGVAADAWHVAPTVPGRPGAIAADDTEIDSGAGANANAVGCMVADHIHHNDNGGWLIADTWYQGLQGALWAPPGDALFADQFE